MRTPACFIPPFSIMAFFPLLIRAFSLNFRLVPGRFIYPASPFFAPLVFFDIFGDPRRAFLRTVPMIVHTFPDSGEPGLQGKKGVEKNTGGFPPSTDPGRRPLADWPTSSYDQVEETVFSQHWVLSSTPGPRRGKLPPVSPLMFARGSPTPPPTLAWWLTSLILA